MLSILNSSQSQWKQLASSTLKSDFSIYILIHPIVKNCLPPVLFVVLQNPMLIKWLAEFTAANASISRLQVLR